VIISQALCTNVVAVADSTAVQWRGGRSALIIHATTYPTTCALQLLGMDGSTWINVSSNLTANGVTAFDLPAGQYRIHMASGTATAVYASLVSIPYM
jgi:hypothetical protein